jgi:hypothetical protein
MLKKSASGVLASLRGSTYRSVRLASSLAAALPDSLFEHLRGRSALTLDVQTAQSLLCRKGFSAVCYRDVKFIMSSRLVPRLDEFRRSDF